MSSDFDTTTLIWLPNEPTFEPGSGNHTQSCIVPEHFIEQTMFQSRQFEHLQPQHPQLAPGLVPSLGAYAPIPFANQPHLGSDGTRPGAAIGSDWNSGDPQGLYMYSSPQQPSIVSPNPTYPINIQQSVPHPSHISNASGGQATRTIFHVSQAQDASSYYPPQPHSTPKNASLGHNIVRSMAGHIISSPDGDSPLAEAIEPNLHASAPIYNRSPISQLPSNRQRSPPGNRLPYAGPYPTNSARMLLRWPSDNLAQGAVRGVDSPKPNMPGGKTVETEVKTGQTPAVMADHPSWRLTQETYDWIVATLDPKKRPDKSVPAPSGQCRLCTSVCQRSGTLQQHIIILHRQKLARKVAAKQRFNLELAIAFVVAQLRSDHGVVQIHPECAEFTKLLARSPEGLAPLPLSSFPFLREKLVTFSAEERWMGVRCHSCGVMVTKRRVLDEHMPLCPGRK